MAAFPQGIEEHHGTSQGNRHASWWRLGVLGLILGAALLGLVGGAPAPTLRVDNSSASLAMTSPDRLRNGMFFETRIAATARRPVADVVIAVPATLWRDMTINSFIPAASEEEYVDGEFRFHFGQLEAGETLGIKVDGQINPPRYGSSGGRLRLLDGEAELVALPVTMKVIP